MFLTFLALFSLFFPTGSIWEENSFLSISQAMARKNSPLKNCWVCYERPSAGKIPEWLIINFTDPFTAHSLPLTGKPLNFTAPLIHLTGITPFPSSTPFVLADVSEYLWNTNIDPGFNVSRDPSCPTPYRTHHPNGSNRTGIPCSLGDTITCHCNGTKETYICTGHHYFQVNNCTIIGQNISGPYCTTERKQTCNYIQTQIARVQFNNYIKNLPCKPCLRSFYKTSTLGVPGNLSADPDLYPSNFTAAKLLCLPSGYLFIGVTVNGTKSEAFGLQCLHPYKTRGSWAIGQLVPNDKQVTFWNNSIIQTMVFSQLNGTYSYRNKSELITLIASLAGLSYDVVSNTMTAASLTHMLGHVAMETGFNFMNIQNCLNAIPKTVLAHHLALDFELVEQGGVCALANTSCCTYINTSGEVEERANHISNEAKWRKEQSQNSEVTGRVLVWLLFILGAIVAISFLLIFSHYFFNLLVKFVSCCSEPK
jgi:hypothetical protein